MAIYAIGDVQGCYVELARLLDLVRFDPAADEAWFVGDLVNRGPRSLDVLRLVMSLGRSATVTLGNHDLHLLGIACGREPGEDDAPLAAILDHAQSGEMIAWLKRRPLAHYRPELNTLMVHAGVIPDWDPLRTVKLSREVEAVLRGPRCDEFLRTMYGERPAAWTADLTGFDRLRFIVNCLTRIRYCRPDGSLDYACTGPPEAAPADLVPWFELPGRAAASVRIVFGHWASLGLLERDNLLGIDTGCVWGRKLTAVRLDGPTRFYSVDADRAYGA